MNLTQFEWALVIGIAVILTGVIGYLFKKSQDQIMIDINKLHQHDCDLAKLIESIVEKLNNHEKWALSEHTHLVSKEDYRDDLKDIKIRMDSFHNRMDEIRDMIADIAQKAVTKEFCNERHEARQ